jgi:hypothetical protein
VAVGLAVAVAVAVGVGVGVDVAALKVAVNGSVEYAGPFCRISNVDPTVAPVNVATKYPLPFVSNIN